MEMSGLCYNDRVRKVYHHPTDPDQFIHDRSVNSMAISEFTTEELATEIWRDVVDQEGLYSVSNLGRVRRDVSGRGHCKAGRILKATRSPDGYQHVSFGSRAMRKNIKVYKIVTAAFFGKRPEGMVVNHKDGVKTNDRLSNLEYITQSENVLHAFRTGLKTAASGDKHHSRRHPERLARGERHGNAKLKDSDVDRIFELRSAGLSMGKIAKAISTSKTHVSRILNGKSRARGTAA
jgi:hypothetical protein